MVDHLHTEILELDIEQLREQLPHPRWEDTGDQHRLRQMLIHKEEILKLRTLARECFGKAWDESKHPVNVATKHARGLLKLFGPLMSFVNVHDEEEEGY